jgi:hypothetical protein
VSPTFEAAPAVWRAYEKLSRRQRRSFDRARKLLVAGLAEEPPSYHPSLRIKRHQASGEGVWELSFGDGGRALFRRGKPVRPGEPHIEWLAIGEHKLVE